VVASTEIAAIQASAGERRVEELATSVWLSDSAQRRKYRRDNSHRWQPSEPRAVQVADNRWCWWRRETADLLEGGSRG
jgi:hypothetical protein